MSIFIISDTHFNHKKLSEIGERPEDFTEIIIDNWHNKVKETDTVIHLGDVILGQASQLPDIMLRLPGIKILVRGNHDEKPSWFEKRGFALVVDSFIRNHILFTHIPVTPIPNNILFNIHGYFHGNTHRYEDLDDLNYYFLNQNLYKEIIIEKTLSPILLEEFLKV